MPAMVMKFDQLNLTKPGQKKEKYEVCPVNV